MKTVKKTWLTLGILIGAISVSGVMAHEGEHGQLVGTEAPTAEQAANDLTDGEVRKLDMAAGKVTLKHGEIKNLEMPGMTMVFQAKDKTLLAALKVGDKIKFRAVNEGGKILLTEIQMVK